MSSRLGNWYARASVRVEPRRLFDEEREQGKIFFPTQLMPYIAHDLVRPLPEGRRRDLAARHLYHYLTFTAHLEHNVVNRAVQRIAHNQAGVMVEPAVQLDAYKIYCDEGYHSLFSFDLVSQIADATGIAALPYDFAPFLHQLDELGSKYLPKEPVLAQLLQVTVFETVVTAILSDVPKDPSVYTTIREVVLDHARDEGTHHAFFAQFFPHLWQGLTPGLRSRVAQYLPDLICGYLRPDTATVAASLLAVGLDAEAAGRVVDETFADDSVLRDIRAAARHTIRLFESAGVLDVAGGRHAFQSSGLV